MLLNINQEKIGSGKGEEMTNINYEKYGAYIPEIISVNKIKNIRLLPKEIKRYNNI